jgi:phosphomannomutase
MVKQIVIQTLCANGVDVIDLDYSTTPTVEMYVPYSESQAGIIITASHNPMTYNALKFLNEKGEFINAEEGLAILKMSEAGKFDFALVEDLGKVSREEDAITYHIDEILKLDLVNVDGIRAHQFKVVVDCINSTGSLAIPPLLDALNVEYILINSEINGVFAHNPEPLAEHLTQLADSVKAEGADFGIVVDPDVDRLAFISEDGTMFGEEYTLVAIADYILSKTPGNTVSNLSSTQALGDVTKKHGQQYYAAAVGEVNVVQKMKEVNAIIGGEGNGGVIYPTLHAGRDALVGIALFLSLLSEQKLSVSELKKTYPQYVISKNKIQLKKGMDIDAILSYLENEYNAFSIDRTDGVKVIMDGEWIHLRKSNTEPIIRIYSESNTKEKADLLAQQVQEKVSEFLK